MWPRRAFAVVVSCVIGVFAVLACSARGNPPCEEEEMQMDARTACAPADATAELVIRPTPPSGRAGRDAAPDVLWPRPPGDAGAHHEAAAPDAVSPY